MSGTGRWRVELQEHPTYRDGYFAAARGEPRHVFVLTGRDAEAWFLGYDDRIDDLRPRVEE